MASEHAGASKMPDAVTGEVWAELERICRSATFSRAHRLQQFLRYVCESTLKGESSLLKEYTLARDIFGRGPDYTASEDSIVRRQAHSLRRKLQEYYADEGRGDPVQIDLPVGRYVPVFQVIENALPEASEVPAPPPPPEIVKRSFRFRTGIIPGAAMALCFAAGWLLSARHTTVVQSAKVASEAPLDPAVREIWSAWLDNPAGASICFSNRMMAIVKYYVKPVEVKGIAGRMRASPAEDADIRQAFALPSFGYIYLTPSLEQTKMGEAMSAVRLANVLAAANTPVRTAESRFLNWETLRTANVIVFGYSENNPLVEPLLSNYPFHLLGADGERLRCVLNTHPAQGEPAEFRLHLSQGPNDPARSYALVSMLPGLDNSHQLLLISGLESECTREATEYLTDPAKVRLILQRLREAAPHHTGPWHFQFVLGTEIRDKVPTTASIAALRVF